MRSVHLLGGLSTTELLSFGLGGCFFVLALATPFFGVRQVKEDAESYAHHLVLSGGFILVLLGLATFTPCSFIAAVLVALPNVIWFVSAHGARRRAQERRGNKEPRE